MALGGCYSEFKIDTRSIREVQEAGEIVRTCVAKNHQPKCVKFDGKL